MVRVLFTPNIQRHVSCPEAQAAGGTVREVLDGVFADNPRRAATCSTTRRRCAGT